MYKMYYIEITFLIFISLFLFIFIFFYLVFLPIDDDNDDNDNEEEKRCLSCSIYEEESVHSNKMFCFSASSHHNCRHQHSSISLETGNQDIRMDGVNVIA